MPRQRWPTDLLSVGLLLFVHGFAADEFYQDDSQYKDLRIGNEWEPRSRMIMVDGNIYFHAGRNKNITFLVTPGSSISFGPTNILDLANGTEVQAMRAAIQQAVNDMNQWRQQAVVDDRKMTEMRTRLVELNGRMINAAAIMREAKNETRVRSRALRKWSRELKKTTEALEKISKLIATNECLQAPCKNGATCVDLVGKYQCLCPPGWQGEQCDERVDECALYHNTSLGCPQNVTCVNNANTTGFHCLCPIGWHGHLCQTKKNSCDQSDGVELCGEHGHCIASAGANGGPGYKCLCEAGYELNGDAMNPECIDKDECRDAPCYPGAECLNLPGSFQCTSCPRGMIGNGINCHDYDECARDETNDCSKSPRVECINKHGSYECGPCPAGYSGDGYQCSRLSPCSEELNPCWSEAECREEPYQYCICPRGMSGDGVGPLGCHSEYRDACRNAEDSGDELCYNGAMCQSFPGWTYKCHCPVGYWGDRCEKSNGCLDEGICNRHGRCLMGGNETATTCECVPGYYGDRCQYEEEGCSFHTTNASGHIFFDRSSLEEKHITTRECTWSIQLLDVRKVLRLTFENYTVPNIYNVTSRGCERSFGNLTIFESIDANGAAEIGNFCYGENAISLQHPIYTSGNQALIRLTTRIQIPQTHLSMKWEAVQPRCGGRLGAGHPEGRIDYYSGAQPEGEQGNCVWYITVPPQYHIEIRVARVTMLSGEGVNCSLNALDVYDNQAVSERTRMASICESRQNPTPLRTSSNHAVVHLRMDSSATLQPGQVGFSLSYKALELPAGCGGEIQASPDGRLEGELESPNYGHQYFPNLDCLWILNVSSVVANNSNQSTDDMKVGIEFVDFDVATSVTSYSNELIAMPGITFTNCLGDFVEVPELYQTFCNLHKPPLTILTAPMLSVRFHTDATVAGRGFLLKYKSLCQKDFTAPNGTIQSPNYPEIARTAFKCTYRIVAQSQQAIKIKLSSIGLHLDVMSCYYRLDTQTALDDYIELSGGHPSDEALNKRYVCARHPFLNGDEIVTSGVRPFEITYSASGDEKRRNKGFMFEYQLLDVGCGGVFFNGGHGETKRVTSPNYPNDYLSHMYCVYHLSVSEGKAIRITFSQFDLEHVGSESGNCTFDSLRIFDSFADESNHGELLGTFCGVSTPPPLLSASGRMVLVFKSDRSLVGTGFSLDFQPVDLKSDCDRTFTALSGEINFDPADYTKGLATECTYHIQLPSNRRILLRFANISLPCDDGTLEVRNGATQESPGFPGLYGDSEVCDDHPVEQLMSQGNRLFIRFASLNLQANYHFRLQYEQLDSACGGHISGIEGAFSAPQYPQKDSRELQCEWHVSTAEGNLLELEFVAIDDLDSKNAGADRCTLYGRNVITVKELPAPTAGVSEEVVLKRYCSKLERAKPLLLDGNQAVVQYTQHGGAYSEAIFGFLAKFTTRCMSVELAGQHGTLQSPGHPTRVLIDRHCKWHIRVAPGNRIRLTFHLFRISNPTTIRSGRGSAVVVRAGGGRRRRRPLVLNAQPDERLNRCGDNYLTFAPEDVAEIYGSAADGSALSVVNESMPRPAFFCNGVAEPREVLTTSNSVEVFFISDRGEPENHFWLTWTSVGCGGNAPITANNSRLLVNASVDFAPTSLKSLRLCQWDIVAPIGYRVHIALEKLWAVEMGPGEDCYNHSETNGLRLYSLRPPPYAVGRKSPPPHETYCRVGEGRRNFSSPSSELSIVYALNTTLAPPPTLKGIVFNATVTFLQATVATNKVDFSGRTVRVTRQASSMVQSPNYPKAFPKGAEAIWQFETPEGYSVGYRLLDYHVGRDYHRDFNDDYDGGRETISNENYTCPYYTAFLRGYLAFLEGTYDKYFIYYGFARGKHGRMLKKICADVDSPGIEIRTESNVSTLVFRSSPYDLPERAENDSKPLGFQLRVMAFCGGRLLAGVERKSINLAPIVGGESGDCEWEITRDPSDDEESETIYLRIEQIGAASATSATVADSSDGQSGAQFEIFCSGASKGVRFSLETSLVPSITDSHFKQYQCESTMRLVAKNLNQRQSFLLSYDTEASFCGGTITGEEGTITLTEVAYGTECEWTLGTVPGSRVELELMSLQLPQSEFCSESYLLIRDSNATGVVLGGKYCGEAAGVASKVERQSLWIRLRHGSANERSSGESARQAASLSMRYKKVYGGFTLSPTIVMPGNVEGTRKDYYSWRIAAKQSGNYLRIEVVEFMVEGDDYSLTFYDIQCEPMRVQSSQEVCSDYDDRAVKFEAGYNLVDGEAYSHTVQSSGATIVFKQGTSRGGFKLHWAEIEPAEANRSTTGVSSGEEVEAESGWTCGGELVAEYEPKYLESPTVLGRYKNNERCKWRIRKPRFSNIILKLKSIDLEEHYTCRYDFIIISGREYATVAELSEAPDYNKLCRKRAVLGVYGEYTLAYDAFVYFYSDQSERMGGFT